MNQQFPNKFKGVFKHIFRSYILNDNETHPKLNTSKIKHIQN